MYFLAGMVHTQQRLLIGATCTAFGCCIVDNAVCCVAVGYCERGDKPSGSIRKQDIFDKLSDNQLSK
jgi:hypothetical protein